VSRVIRRQNATNNEEGYGVADIHIHSSVSDGMADVSHILEYVEECTDLDVIAITDHDKMEGSFRARELAAKCGYRFEVITGMEVTTLEGHLLALYLENPVPSFRLLAETIEAIHSYGGLSIAPHSMNRLADSIMRRSLDKIVASSEQGFHLDGIETIGGGIVRPIPNRRASDFNCGHRLAETGSSDAHFLATVGSAVTLSPGRNAMDLKRSLLQRTTTAANGFRVRLRDLRFTQFTRYLVKSRGSFVRNSLKGIKRSIAYEHCSHLSL